MNQLHTPIKIDFLLSIYCGSFRRNNFPQHTSPISEKVLQGLIEDKLVMHGGGNRDYLLTIQGMEFVERLLNTPLEPPAPVIGDHLRKETSLRREVAGKTDHVINQGAQALETFKLYMTYAGNTDDRDFEFNIWRAVRQLGWIVEEHLAKEQKS